MVIPCYQSPCRIDSLIRFHAKLDTSRALFGPREVAALVLPLAGGGKVMMVPPSPPAREKEGLERICWELDKDPPHGVNIAPSATDRYRVQVTLLGPHGSPYEGGIFKLDWSYSPHHVRGHQPPPHLSRQRQSLLPSPCC